MMLHMLLASFYLNAKPQMLTVAIDSTPPYAFIDKQGRPSGMIVDVMQKLSSRLPFDFEYIECPWARCVKLVENGEIDLLPGITRTHAREQIFFYIEPAFMSHHKINQFRFYSINKNLAITDYVDLQTLNIGILRGAAYNPEFDDDNTITKTAFVDVQSLFDALHKNRIDAFIYHDDTVVPLLKQFDPLNQITESTLGLSAKQNGYIVMSKKSIHLAQLPAINNQLKALIEEGEISLIFRRHGLYQ